MNLSTPKTYRRDELGNTAYDLSTHSVHPTPPPLEPMKFRFTNFQASYNFETIFNVFLDPEYIIMQRIKRQNAFFRHIQYAPLTPPHGSSWGLRSPILTHPIALKPFPTHVAAPKTYRRHELGMKNAFLAICCLHPYPTPLGFMKFEVTHFDAPDRFKNVSNLRIDSKNLQSRGISLKIAIFDHFPRMQKYQYGRKSQKSQKEQIRFSSSFF